MPEALLGNRLSVDLVLATADIGLIRTLLLLKIIFSWRGERAF